MKTRISFLRSGKDLVFVLPPRQGAVPFQVVSLRRIRRHYDAEPRSEEYRAKIGVPPLRHFRYQFLHHHIEHGARRAGLSAGDLYLFLRFCCGRISVKKRRCLPSFFPAGCAARLLRERDLGCIIRRMIFVNER